jgi:quercetin dioxygenase-like cupin family protein
MGNYRLSSWKKTEKELLDSKLTQQIFTSEKVMLVRYVYESGLKFPNHSHPQEQVTYVIEGELEFIIEGKKVILEEGDICAIEPNVQHSTIMRKKRAVAISIFTPVKENVIIDSNT